MKTYKTKRTVCRSRKSGRFSRKKKCGMYKKTKVRAFKFGDLFKL